MSKKAYSVLRVLGGTSSALFAHPSNLSLETLKKKRKWARAIYEYAKTWGKYEEEEKFQESS